MTLDERVAMLERMVAERRVLASIRRAAGEFPLVGLYAMADEIFERCLTEARRKRDAAAL